MDDVKLHEISAGIDVKAKRREMRDKIGSAITLIADEANWIAHEAARSELSTVNIHIRISSGAYPSVNISFEQFAGWEGKNICSNQH